MENNQLLVFGRYEALPIRLAWNATCRRRRQQHAERGICRECNKPAVAGRKHCETCLARYRSCAKSLYYERKQKGVCVFCGGPKDGTTVKCTECKQRREVVNRSCSKKRYYKMKEKGLCIQCGNSSRLHKIRCSDCAKLQAKLQAK